MFFGIWRGFEEEVKEAEVETINQILTMLTNKEGRGKLGLVQLPKAMLLKSDCVEHLGGEAEIKKVAAPSTNYFCGCSVRLWQPWQWEALPVDGQALSLNLLTFKNGKFEGSCSSVLTYTYCLSTWPDVQC